MLNNDCLRRIRYILDLDDTKMIAMFAHAEQIVTRAQISSWLKKDDDEGYLECEDTMFAGFLNGLIIDKRGKRDGPKPVPETQLNNNMIFMKLKIVFNLKAEEILSMLAASDQTVSKHELSAFFRRPDHKHYRECKDQILRNFMNGLQAQHREQG